ncbi:MAG: pyridoxamine 5'-phosphate oxidase family protein [Planctomycetota bacterium]
MRTEPSSKAGPPETDEKHRSAKDDKRIQNKRYDDSSRTIDRAPIRSARLSIQSDIRSNRIPTIPPNPPLSMPNTTQQSTPPDLWAHLVRGKADRKHPYHQPALATTDTEGYPSVRTVVLRKADPDSGVLHAHTDARASKVAHIAQTPIAAWHFYDPGQRLQIRATGPTQVLTDDPIADQAWQDTRLFSRRCYLAPHTPGSETQDPDPNLPPDLISTNPQAERSEEGRANFAVVRTTVHTLEWLTLASTGHTRGVFTRSGDDWHHRWLAP